MSINNNEKVNLLRELKSYQNELNNLNNNNFLGFKRNYNMRTESYKTTFQIVSILLLIAIFGLLIWLIAKESNKR